MLGREGFFKDEFMHFNEYSFLSENNLLPLTINHVKTMILNGVRYAGFPQPVKQEIVYSENKELLEIKIIHKTKEELKKETKQWLYDYFKNNGFNVKTIKDWNLK